MAFQETSKCVLEERCQEFEKEIGKLDRELRSKQDMEREFLGALCSSVCAHRSRVSTSRDLLVFVLLHHVVVACVGDGCLCSR